jgi:uncharacterized Zn finger protein
MVHGFEWGSRDAEGDDVQGMKVHHGLHVVEFSEIAFRLKIAKRRESPAPVYFAVNAAFQEAAVRTNIDWPDIISSVRSMRRGQN